MEETYEEYEEKCREIRRQNEELLKLFESDMASLSPKTIQKHLDNVDFYINNYLLREDALTMENGVAYLDSFLGYFFIRKCMWSTLATIKGTAASIKKFYKCMLDHGKLKKEQYECLCSEIKDSLQQWMDDCAQYNDPDAESPFMFF